MSKNVGLVEKLIIGQELWRFTWPNMLHYKVVGIRAYEDSEQYEVECQSCKHGKLCKVLIGRDDYDKLHTVNMLNNDEDDDQRCWHTRDDLSTAYCTTKEGAQRERLRRSKAKAEDAVKSAQLALDNANKYLGEINNAYELLGERP